MHVCFFICLNIWKGKNVHETAQQRGGGGGDGGVSEWKTTNRYPRMQDADVSERETNSHGDYSYEYRILITVASQITFTYTCRAKITTHTSSSSPNTVLPSRCFCSSYTRNRGKKRGFSSYAVHDASPSSNTLISQATRSKGINEDSTVTDSDFFVTLPI